MEFKTKKARSAFAAKLSEVQEQVVNGELLDCAITNVFPGEPEQEQAFQVVREALPIRYRRNKRTDSLVCISNYADKAADKHVLARLNKAIASVNATPTTNQVRRRAALTTSASAAETPAAAVI